jgi:hypothetical protein
MWSLLGHSFLLVIVTSRAVLAFSQEELGHVATWHNKCDLRCPHNNKLMDQVAFQLCWQVLWIWQRDNWYNDQAIFLPWLIVCPGQSWSSSDRLNWSHAWMEFSCLLERRLFSSLFPTNVRHSTESMCTCIANTVGERHCLILIVTLAPHLVWAPG